MDDIGINDNKLWFKHIYKAVHNIKLRKNTFTTWFAQS